MRELSYIGSFHLELFIDPQQYLKTLMWPASTRSGVMSDDQFKAFLANHPRATSLLFGAMVLLAQVGTVAAANGGTYRGP